LTDAVLDAPIVAGKAYDPLGGNARLMSCQDREILFDGPAGTGKTRAVCEKANAVAWQVPGARILFLRRFRASLTESVLVTFERDVVPHDWPVLRGPHRRMRSSYDYPNGSTIVLGGLADVGAIDKIKSTEYDLICLFEATEPGIRLEDWDVALSRLRNHVLPYQQAIADCNPSFPAHWLKQRADEGKMTRIQTKHADNPTVTPEYLETLRSLSGHRYDRLFRGVWAAAEGLVYDNWDESVNVVAFPEDHPWKRWILSVDAGYTNPCSMGLWAVDGDGRMHRKQEWVRTQQREAQVVERAAHYATHYDLEAVVVDPEAATLIAAMEEAGLPVQQAHNRDVYGGLQLVIGRIPPALDGFPRLTIDPSCTNSINEVLGYQWKKNRDGSQRDEPEKKNDHSMDDWRYAVRYFDDNSGDWSVTML